MACLSHNLPVFIHLLLLISFCRCDDQLRHAKRLISPSDMLISKGGDFALGFFSPATSNQSLFLGIWYHNISERTYVWVANRDDPIAASSSATLSISNNSALVLSDSKGRTLWTTMASPNSIVTEDDGVYAVLLDSGNLVLRLSNNTTIWQSFDQPTDTILPNMKFLVRSYGQVAMRFIAWKGPDDPSTGDFSFSGDPTSNFQIFIWHETRPYYRFILFDSVSVSGATYLHNSTSFVYKTVVNTKDEFYLKYTISDDSPYTRVMIDYMGNFRFMSWNSSLSSWTVANQLPRAPGCDTYGSCGPFGYCDLTSAVPSCQCLDGFEPVGSNSSSGCRRKQQLRCGDDHFVIMSRMKVPDKFLHVQNRNFDECTDECTRNCSCTAYAYTNLTATGTMSNQPRCLLWTGELADAWRDIRNTIAENLYLRLADSTVNRKKKRHMVVNIVLPAIVCLLILTACIYLVSKCKSRGVRQNKEKTKRPVIQQLSTIHDLWDQNLEFPCISFEDITAATDSFHDTNMLGKGGFGKVYKGTLEDGKEIAVKRLSKCSEQGMEQFRNELVLIAKLQHKNLVRLLGCCIHGDEKLLIYEYLPNKSLDKFLFNHTTEATLDWLTRFNIIKGVARGLLYLHQDSRMKIIHRDLKASNILLDGEMNPKISDFGMARIFGGNEQQESTRRVVGTYGYMSPEYAMEGTFSVKSDTYSFGILLLEIVSGLKISSPHHLVMDFPNLIAYAWNLWKDGRQRDFVDKSILESCSLSEVFKCIHIGLMCVQDSPNARPLMSFVVSMLENEDMPHPIPTQPIYFVQRHYESEEPREYSDKSVNNVSLTILEGR
uniref:Receptor-like serine/threonine-protein kinase n=1 Tax=Oryza sativa subsp. japonica TaxID=39947 RepID=Q7XQU0_ORYSJ|nr:OSJNBa0043L09.7 [Oryza sativa Japonica Group]